MVVLLRFGIFLFCVAFAVNAGVSTGGRTNPGAGTVWGIVVFVFWLFILNIALILLHRAKCWIGDKMDGMSY